MKTLQLLPGVMSAGDGNTGFYVRGGGPDQNLVLLDDAVVYNTGHLFGFFSVFNSDAIKDVTLIKGGAAANYGGRLSSVIDVSMKEGNMKEFHAEGGIGLIASRLTLQGPIKKNKGSFMLAGRRTYADVLAKPFLKGNAKGSGYYFYDLNLKANYIISSKDRVYLSGYLGLDQFSYNSSNGHFSANIPWGNTTLTARWNHLFSDKLFLNTTLLYNDYHFSFNSSQNLIGVKLFSGIHDYNAKTDLEYYPNNQNHIKVGMVYTYHTFTPNQVSGSIDTIQLKPDNALIKYAHEAAAYVLDDIEVNKWLRINIGLRYSWFGQIGPYTSYVYDNNNIKTDSTVYGSGKMVKSYGGLEPRFNVRFGLNEASSIKASIAKTYQYLHLVSNNGTTLPTDVWVPSTDLVKPEIAWQYSIGYFRNFLENKLETSVEVYYKDMQNQIEYKDSYTPNNLQDPQYSYVYGKGWSYGAEFFINKTQGKFTGWIGYTLAWTNKQFPDLNSGNAFPAKYDRRNDLSVVGSYEYSKKWTFSAVFIYATGNPVTLPIGFYPVGNQLVELFGPINSYRLPDYHRLDIATVYTPQHKIPKRWQGSWTFSIFNVYNRANPFFFYVDTQGTTSTTVTNKVMEVYIFPIIPSITYNFKF
jgi:outer membrane receptor protein involved in Fe transport